MLSYMARVTAADIQRRRPADLALLILRCAVHRDGVSRLSAYHHFGMISPFKVARDALATKSNGATKYVDEFFTWREVAHAFCFRSWPVLESTAVGLLSILRLAASLADVLVWSILSYVTRVPCLAETIRPQQSGQPYLKQCHHFDRVQCSAF